MSNLSVTKHKRGSGSGIQSPNTPNASSRIPGALNKKSDKSDKSDRNSSVQQDAKLSVSVAADETEPAIKMSHRDLSKCPCLNSSSNSWLIDCSKCKQYWHVDCLSLSGLSATIINKLVDFRCPFCWVSPVPTIKNDSDICYICRNTLSLQQANNMYKTMLSSEKLNSLQKLASVINSVDFDKFSAQVGTIQNFDLHLQHLLLNQNSLEEYQGSVREIEKRTNTMSSSVEKAMADISGQISSLQSQVDELSASSAHIPSAEIDNSGEV